MGIEHLVHRVPALRKMTEIIDDAVSIKKPHIPVVLVICGIGGQGKTQIALSYCRNIGSTRYRGIFWIDASSERSTVQGFEKIAVNLSRAKKILGAQHLTHEKVKQELELWKEQWLLVFDNYDDTSSFDIKQFIPQGTNGTILITTRDISLSIHGWHRMELPPMNEKEAMELLLHGRESENLSETDKEAGKAFIERLGYLPLAIDQARWYFSNVQLSSELHRAIDAYEAQKAELITTIPDEFNWSYKRNEKSQNWFTTFEFSLQPLERNHPLAAHILTLSAFLGDAVIDEEFFHEAFSSQQALNSKGGSVWIRELEKRDGTWDTSKFRKIIKDLGTRSLVKPHRTSDSAAYSLHPVIREWLRLRPQAHRANFSLESALMMAPFVVANMERPLEFSRRQDIVVHLDSLIERPGILSTLTTDPDYNSVRYPPLYSFACFFRRCSRLKTAKFLLQDLAAARQTAGISAKDPTSIDIQIELGYTLRDLAEFKAGMECLEAVKEASKEINTTAYCRCLIGLADALSAQHLLNDARATAQEALDLADKLEGQWRLRTDIRLVMTKVEGQRGRIKESGRLINEAYNMAKEHLGPEDDLTLEVEAIVAYNFLEKRQPSKAKEVIEAVLSKLERRNGIDHRNTLNAVLWKGIIYSSVRLHSEARELFELSKSRARLQFENTPGEISVEIAIGQTFAEEGNFPKAREQFELAKSMSEKTKDQLNLRRATMSLFILYMRHGYLMRAFPMMKMFIETFPFAYNIRTNKMTWGPGTVLILLFILSWFQARFAITAGLSVGVIAAAILI